MGVARGGISNEAHHFSQDITDFNHGRYISDRNSIDIADFYKGARVLGGADRGETLGTKRCEFAAWLRVSTLRIFIEAQEFSRWRADGKSWAANGTNAHSHGNLGHK